MFCSYTFRDWEKIAAKVQQANERAIDVGRDDLLRDSEEVKFEMVELQDPFDKSIEDLEEEFR